MSEPETTGEKLDGKFKPGFDSRRAPGRPKGSRNALAEDFLKALADDFKAHGVPAIVACREEKPTEYVKIIAGLMPKEMNLNVSAAEEMEDAELIATIRALESAIYAAVSGAAQPQAGIQAPAGHAETPTLPPLH